jgi:hypothetical protein
MPGAMRKTKVSKYEVTVRRDVELAIVVTLEARNAEEAEDIARNSISEIHWRDSSIANVISQTSKAKKIS